MHTRSGSGNSQQSTSGSQWRLRYSGLGPVPGRRLGRPDPVRVRESAPAQPAPYRSAEGRGGEQCQRLGADGRERWRHLTIRRWLRVAGGCISQRQRCRRDESQARAAGLYRARPGRDARRTGLEPRAHRAFRLGHATAGRAEAAFRGGHPRDSPEGEMMGTVLVTGASAGFGAAIAAKFAENGWRVVACARRADRLTQLVKRFGAERVHCAAFDIRDETAMRAALDALAEHFRDIDVLVNNAGLALGTAKAQDCDLAQWRQMIDTNVTALVTLTRLLLPGLIERR